MDLELKGKTALVTGASNGIGRGIALRLGQEGVHLAIQGRDREKLEAVAAEITAGGGAAPVIVVCELTDADAAEKISSAATAGLGQVDILVNSAGGSRPFDLDTTEAEWEEAMTLNFTRPRQIATALIPGMRKNKFGRIINITGKSEAIRMNGAVCAKAAVHAWSKGTSKVVGGDGITINCVAPGKIMSAQILRLYSEEFRSKQAEEDIPVGRYGDPSDMGNMVSFLVSPIASYITGAVIPVDGGLRRYLY